jgi:hypothetical protein
LGAAPSCRLWWAAWCVSEWETVGVPRRPCQVSAESLRFVLWDDREEFVAVM